MRMPKQRQNLQPLFTCPVCGFFGLKTPPYEKLGNPPWNNHGKPPYCQKYGKASYDICPCCSFEFGLEDEAPDSTKSVSFEKYLQQWIAEGCVWFQLEFKPHDWNLRTQLQKAGIKYPNG
jgi:hypothetical protein